MEWVNSMGRQSWLLTNWLIIHLKEHKFPFPVFCKTCVRLDFETGVVLWSPSYQTKKAWSFGYTCFCIQLVSFYKQSAKCSLKQFCDVCKCQVYGYARNFAKIGVARALVDSLHAGLSSPGLVSASIALRTIAVNVSLSKSDKMSKLTWCWFSQWYFNQIAHALLKNSGWRVRLCI